LIHQAHSPASRDELKQRPNRLCHEAFRCAEWLPEKRRGCTAPRRPGTDRCFWHDPAMGSARREAGARGGSALRRGTAIPSLARFRFDSLNTQAGIARFRRLLFGALLRREATTAGVRLLDELAERIRANSTTAPAGSRTAALLRDFLMRKPLPLDGDAVEPD